MKIELPYDKLELVMALHSIDMSKFTEGAMKELLAEIEKEIPLSIAEKNKEVAKENGVTVAELINSPNYQLLYDRYLRGLLGLAIQKVMNKFGLTEKQAWAGYALSRGLI